MGETVDDKEHIMEVLRNEDIRVIDGRYGRGFVDLETLQSMIRDGAINTFTTETGFTFATLRPK